MRDKAPNRNQHRDCGAVDPRISNIARKQSMSLIPTQVGTPLVWIDPDVIDMSTVGTMGTFTDRMDISWSVTASCAGLYKLAGAMNGRNAFQSRPTEGTVFTTCMQSTNITTAEDVTVFWVFRDGFYNNAFPALYPIPVAKNTINSEWLFLEQPFRQITWRYKVGVADRSYPFQNGSMGDIYIVCGTGSAADAAIYVNSTTATASGAPASTLASASTPIYYGAYGPSPTTYPTLLQMGDFIVYGSALATADRNAVMYYLGRKYGIAIT